MGQQGPGGRCHTDQGGWGAHTHTVTMPINAPLSHRSRASAPRITSGRLTPPRPLHTFHHTIHLPPPYPTPTTPSTYPQPPPPHTLSLQRCWAVAQIPRSLGQHLQQPLHSVSFNLWYTSHTHTHTHCLHITHAHTLPAHHITHTHCLHITSHTHTHTLPAHHITHTHTHTHCLHITSHTHCL